MREREREREGGMDGWTDREADRQMTRSSFLEEGTLSQIGIGISLKLIYTAGKGRNKNIPGCKSSCQ